MNLSLSLVTMMVVLVSPLSCQEEQDWNLWPLFTPLLNVSDICLDASTQYITLINEALTTTEPLTVEQKNAIQMFDSNGKFPFFQEGILQVVANLDLCDSILSKVPDCRDVIPEELRSIRMPYGNSNGPGSESGCKAASEAKYCHNYWQFYVDLHPEENVTELPLNPKQNLDGFTVAILEPELKFSALTDYKVPHRKEISPLRAVDPSKLINLYDLLVERNSYFRVAHRQLTELLGNRTLFPQYQDNPIKPSQVIALLISLWAQINWTNGVGQWGFSFPIAYQGMCFPSACSVEDIERNSVSFGSEYFMKDLGYIISSPVLNEGLGTVFQMKHKDVIRQSVGCSDDDVYVGNWNTSNYVVVTVLSIIAIFILVGTVLDLYENSSDNLAYQIVKAFSLKENIKFVFEAPAKGAGSRFGCLEGMRSLSMTWVILGHHFLFGQSNLHVINKDYIGQIQSQKAGGIMFEAVLQGEYSVDTFLFIGATLLSFLLLKDLDKSNGWFSSGTGFVRMILFYLNRYLRISIPYALTMAVFIGVIPLALRDRMDAGHLAYSEAEECKRVMGYKLAYINIFPDYDGSCLGQTWYLSCDMLLFVVSPLLIYPLWIGKFGTGRKVVSILWWFCVLGASCGFAYWYVFHGEKYGEWQEKYSLPTYNFSPWGWRNQCYIIGIMTGYLLWITKDKKVVINRTLNALVWFNVIVLGLMLVYRTYRGFHNEKLVDKAEWRSYYAFRKAAWGFCLMWVTFSCCRGYGGVINHFLSWSFWLPISKISFMTYLFHMSINWEFFLLQSYQLNYSMWQVWICLLAGLLGCLTLELPFGKIQKILIQRLLSMITGGKK